VAGFFFGAFMAIKSIRVLCRMEFPTKTTRLWDGAGPYMDQAGDVWAGMVLNEGLDQIESAMNGEAATLMLALSGVDQTVSDLAYDDLEAGDVIGAKVQIMIQPCDEFDQPVGDAEVRFTGTIDNMLIDDAVQGDNVVSQVTVECTNRFNLRTLTSGSVLSDVDQKARSAIMNPGAPADRFAERIPGLSDKTIVWPRFS
jgi:hypothetical protein